MLICILFNAHDMRDRQLMLVEKYAIISECMYMLSSSMYATISLFLLSFCFFYIHFILLIKRDETQRTVRNTKKKQQPTIEAVCTFTTMTTTTTLGINLFFPCLHLSAICVTCIERLLNVFVHIFFFSFLLCLRLHRSIQCRIYIIHYAIVVFFSLFHA